MFSAMLIRVGTIALHSIMGGMAVFCLWYASLISDPTGVRWLVIEALKCGVPAVIILYFQVKYLG
jgi:hypothetical protein